MNQTEIVQKGIFLYFNYADYLDLLSMKERGELFTALMEGAEIEDMSRAAKVAFRFMHAQALRDAEKSMTNSANGKRGGRPKSVESEEKVDEAEVKANESEVKANESEAKANESEAKANESELKPNKDKDKNENEKEKDSIYSSRGSEAASPDGVGASLKESLSKSALEREFNRVWELYPRKAGRKEALNAYVRARKKGVSLSTIEAGVKEYAEVCRSRDPQYIKYGSSWFNGEGWNDREREVKEYDGASSKFVYSAYDDLFADSTL